MDDPSSESEPEGIGVGIGFNFEVPPESFISEDQLSEGEGECEPMIVSVELSDKDRLEVYPRMIGDRRSPMIVAIDLKPHDFNNGKLSDESYALSSTNDPRSYDPPRPAESLLQTETPPLSEAPPSVTVHEAAPLINEATPPQLINSMQQEVAVVGSSLENATPPELANDIPRQNNASTPLQSEATPTNQPEVVPVASIVTPVDTGVVQSGNSEEEAMVSTNNTDPGTLEKSIENATSVAFPVSELVAGRPGPDTRSEEQSTESDLVAAQESQHEAVPMEGMEQQDSDVMEPQAPSSVSQEPEQQTERSDREGDPPQPAESRAQIAQEADAEVLDTLKTAAADDKQGELTAVEAFSPSREDSEALTDLPRDSNPSQQPGESDRLTEEPLSQPIEPEQSDSSQEITIEGQFVTPKLQTPDFDEDDKLEVSSSSEGSSSKEDGSKESTPEEERRSTQSGDTEPVPEESPEPPATETVDALPAETENPTFSSRSSIEPATEGEELPAEVDISVTSSVEQATAAIEPMQRQESPQPLEEAMEEKAPQAPHEEQAISPAQVEQSAEVEQTMEVQKQGEQSMEVEKPVEVLDDPQLEPLSEVSEQPQAPLVEEPVAQETAEPVLKSETPPAVEATTLCEEEELDTSEQPTEPEAALDQEPLADQTTTDSELPSSDQQPSSSPSHEQPPEEQHSPPPSHRPDATTTDQPLNEDTTEKEHSMEAPPVQEQLAVEQLPLQPSVHESSGDQASLVDRASDDSPVCESSAPMDSELPGTANETQITSGGEATVIASEVATTSGDTAVAMDTEHSPEATPTETTPTLTPPTYVKPETVDEESQPMDDETTPTTTPTTDSKAPVEPQTDSESQDAMTSSKDAMTSSAAGNPPGEVSSLESGPVEVGFLVHAEDEDLNVFSSEAAEADQALRRSSSSSSLSRSQPARRSSSGPARRSSSGPASAFSAHSAVASSRTRKPSSDGAGKSSPSPPPPPAAVAVASSSGSSHNKRSKDLKKEEVSSDSHFMDVRTRVVCVLHSRLGYMYMDTKKYF